MRTRRKTNAEPIRKNRQFGITVGAILLLLSAYIYFQHQYLSLYLIITASVLILSTRFFPQILTPIRIIWDKIGYTLGVINTYILLTLIYFLVLVPIGWMLRMAGKDLLGKKLQPQAKTYWEPKKLKSSMKYQF